MRYACWLYMGEFVEEKEEDREGLFSLMQQQLWNYFCREKKSGRENLPLLLTRDDWKEEKGKLSDRQAIGGLFVDDGPWI